VRTIHILRRESPGGVYCGDDECLRRGDYESVYVYTKYRHHFVWCVECESSPALAMKILSMVDLADQENK
jgi:hypothetical protein